MSKQKSKPGPSDGELHMELIRKARDKVATTGTEYEFARSVAKQAKAVHDAAMRELLAAIDDRERTPLLNNLS